MSSRTTISSLDADLPPLTRTPARPGLMARDSMELDTARLANCRCAAATRNAHGINKIWNARKRILSKLRQRFCNKIGCWLAVRKAEKEAMKRAAADEKRRQTTALLNCLWLFEFGDSEVDEEEEEVGSGSGSGDDQAESDDQVEIQAEAQADAGYSEVVMRQREPEWLDERAFFAEHRFCDVCCSNA